MKVNWKSLLATGLSAVLAVSLLSGCGGGGKKGGSGGKDGEASVWHYFEHEAKALEKFIDEYNEQQDEITLKATYVSRDELMNQYTIGAVSGELPDIGMVDSPDMASYIELGVFEDITEYLEKWGELDQFYKGPLSSCKDSEGKLYGIPNNSNCLTLLCNMDILNAAGFTEGPKTWEEFEQICAATTNKADSVFGFSMSLISTEEGTFQYMPWLYGAGGSVTKIDSNESIEALTFLSNLVSNGYMSKEVVNWQQGDAYNAFVAGKAAMLESGTWQIATLDEDIEKAGTNINYQFILMPEKDGKRATTIGGENFGVCTGADNIEACAEFLTYMTSAEKNGEWCEIAGKLPVREDGNQYNKLLEDERVKVFSDMMEFAVARGPHPSWPTLSEAVYSSAQSAVLGEKTPEEALKEAAKTIDPLLKENPIKE